MRLPHLRLPTRPLEWIDALGGRTMLLYVSYTVVLFAAFLLLTFPHELLVRRLLSSADLGPVSVDFSAVNFAWYEGYEISGLRVLSAAGGNEPTPYLECNQLWVRPSLGALLHGDPYDLLLSAALYGGAAQGEVSLSDGLHGAVEWQDLRLDRYRTLTSLLDTGQLVGQVSGQLNFALRPGNAQGDQSTGTLTVDGAGLTAAKIDGMGVPDVHFRQIRAKYQIHGDRLDLQEFTATGDVSVQASGHIMLRTPITDSTLNLRANLQTSLATPDALKAAVALIPRTPGAKPDAPISITGTLGRPRSR